MTPPRPDATTTAQAPHPTTAAIRATAPTIQDEPRRRRRAPRLKRVVLWIIRSLNQTVRPTPSLLLRPSRPILGK